MCLSYNKVILSTAPSIPVLDETFLPIVNLVLPPETTAETVIFDYYNNQSMTETELRTLADTVDTVQYNLAQFALQTNTATQQAASDLLGILADPLVDATVADISNPSFSGTFDFINGLFLLPRTAGSANPTVSTSSGVSNSNGVYTLAYSEELAISQPFYTTGRSINSFGAVNERATVSCNPSTVLNTATTTTVVSEQTSTVVSLSTETVKNVPIITYIKPQDKSKYEVVTYETLKSVSTEAVVIPQGSSTPSVLSSPITTQPLPAPNVGLLARLIKVGWMFPLKHWSHCKILPRH